MVRSRRCVAIARGPPHHAASQQQSGEQARVESVDKIIALIFTKYVARQKFLRDLRIAEIVQLDMHIENGKVAAYRAKVKVSFKFEGGN